MASTDEWTSVCLQAMNGKKRTSSQQRSNCENFALSISGEDVFKCEQLPFATLLHKCLQCENLAPACTSLPCINVCLTVVSFYYIFCVGVSSVMLAPTSQ